MGNGKGWEGEEGRVPPS